MLCSGRVVAVKAAVLNLLSISAAYGVLILVTQQHGAGDLRGRSDHGGGLPVLRARRECVTGARRPCGGLPSGFRRDIVIAGDGMAADDANRQHVRTGRHVPRRARR
ncbi:MAG TPA: hypothetical protein DEH11_20460 [Actinobacteria bacterium]|nr:hypothetical protein [Actinomycetota bacterium]